MGTNRRHRSAVRVETLPPGSDNTRIRYFMKSDDRAVYSAADDTFSHFSAPFAVHHDGVTKIGDIREPSIEFLSREKSNEPLSLGRFFNTYKNPGRFYMRVEKPKKNGMVCGVYVIDNDSPLKYKVFVPAEFSAKFYNDEHGKWAYAISLRAPSVLAR
ncbi:MAG TPA: hypothetical protein VJI12_02715 [archaeon]|nr:hypothetical protein [archaeon]